MRWTRQRQAWNWGLQGGHFGARERPQGNADDGAACVRRSRVVLASVAGVKGRRAGVQIRTPETLKPDGDKNEFVTGESTKETVKTIARGMPGCSGVTVVTTLVCFYLFCTRGCGRIARPAFPAPSFSKGRDVDGKTRAKTRGEIAKLCLRKFAV